MKLKNLIFLNLLLTTILSLVFIVFAASKQDGVGVFLCSTLFCFFITAFYYLNKKLN